PGGPGVLPGRPRAPPGPADGPDRGRLPHLPGTGGWPAIRGRLPPLLRSPQPPAAPQGPPRRGRPRAPVRGATLANRELVGARGLDLFGHPVRRTPGPPPPPPLRGVRGPPPGEGLPGQPPAAPHRPEDLR